MSAIGRRVRLMATGVGDDEPVETNAPIDGGSVMPPAPVHLTAARTADGLLVNWVRRSRLGWRWSDGADAPLGEEREAYRVSARAADGAETVVEVTEPRCALATVPAGRIAVSVRQLGTNGPSPPATVTIEGESG